LSAAPASARQLTELAPAKVNLGLFLGPLRPDGRHELVTVFESVSLCDELSVTARADGPDEVICAGVDGPNLVGKAVDALRGRGWKAKPLLVEIVKRIPVAAGMGGGSADAAALLRIAPRLAPVAAAEVDAVAGELGADVPAQLAPGLALGSGAGDVVQPRPALAPHALVIVPLQAQLSTATVYAEADRLGLPRAAEELERLRGALDRALLRDAVLPAELLVNDLEPAARSLCPAVGGALDAVRACGADAALVCGSGPTVAGVYWGGDGGARAERAAGGLRAQFPDTIAVLPVSSQASGKIRMR
jgi:4-diphosphocytidyl-2-C-methyl-D-erythritol kinase